MKIETLKRCEVCGGVYRPNGYRQIYCNRCKPTRRHSREKVCDMCGIRFTDHSTKNNAKYCSNRCRRLAHNEQSANCMCRIRTDRLWREVK